MSEFSGWVNLAIKFYAIIALIWSLLIGGCVYSCYRVTGHGVRMEIK